MSNVYMLIECNNDFYSVTNDSSVIRVSYQQEPSDKIKVEMGFTTLTVSNLNAIKKFLSDNKINKCNLYSYNIKDSALSDLNQLSITSKVVDTVQVYEFDAMYYGNNIEKILVN